MNLSLTSVEALALLEKGQSVEDAIITGKLRLAQISVDEFGTVRTLIVLRRCHLEEVEGAFLLFDAQVSFEDCTFKLASFYAAYFFQGAEFVNCTFLSEVTFDCGGHNTPPACFRLESCTFKGFVNFFDNYFPGPVEVRGCQFEQGTNLLGNVGQPFEVQFEVPPVIEGNSGELALDGG